MIKSLFLVAFVLLIIIACQEKIQEESVVYKNKTCDVCKGRGYLPEGNFYRRVGGSCMVCRGTGQVKEIDRAATGELKRKIAERMERKEGEEKIFLKITLIVAVVLFFLGLVVMMVVKSVIKKLTFRKGG